MNQKGSRAMNVQSVLLQPVQRVTKYPLMLAELNKHTPTTHPDKGDLGMAVERLQQAVGVINQNKRAKEVIERYKVRYLDCDENVTRQVLFFESK